MGQVASHISGYFSQQPKQEEVNKNVAEIRTWNDAKVDFKVRSFFKEHKSRDNTSFDLRPPSSCFSLATPRNPLKRTRRDSLPSLPQNFVDKIFSRPKRPKIDTDEFIDYPFLNHHETIGYYKKSKILVIMRGLPGSGKSTIVKHLEKKYGSLKVCSADHFFMKDGEYVYDRDLIREAHAQCQKNALAAVQDQVHVVVIDNTNLKLWEMRFYLELADEFNYVPVTVEPQTPWVRDVAILASKSTHNISEEIIQFKHDSMEEVLPVYFGWFLNEKDSVALLEEGQIWIEEAYKIPQFRDEFQYHTETSTLEELIEYYKKAGMGRILHITAKYIGKEFSSDNQKYIDSKEFKSSLGKAFEINVVGFVLTPRTLGTRVRLTHEQLLLWDKDDMEEVPPEFWEVETPEEPSITEDAPEEAELSLNLTSTLNGNTHLPNGNGELPSDSEEGNNHNVSSTSVGTVSEDNTSSVDDESQDVVENGKEPVEKSALAKKETSSSDPVDNGQVGGSKPGRQETTNEQKTSQRSHDLKEKKANSPLKNRSPTKSSRFSPRKGNNSPKKRTGPFIPENDLDIDHSSTEPTWKAFPSNTPANLRFFPTSGKGSRAHLTLGCAPKVKAVTTGLDLVFAVKKEAMAHGETDRNTSELDNDEPHTEYCSKLSVHKRNLPNGNSPTSGVSTFPVNGGVIRNYGNGVWVFYPEELLVAHSVFSAYHGK